MANEYTLGQKISGIGAALSGRVPEFQQRMQQLDEARMKAMYQDAGAAYQMLQSDNFGGIIDLADDRLNILRRLPGSDTSDTENVRMLAQRALSGDVGAKSELGSILEQAQITGIQLGYVKAPAADQARVLKPGDRLVGPAGNVITEYTKPEEPNLRTLSPGQRVVGPDGSVIYEYEKPPEDPTLRAVNPGQRLVDPQGEVVYTAPPEEPKPSAREERINDIMRTFSVNRQQAISALETQTFMNPETGNMMTYNRITGEAKALETAIPYRAEFFAEFPEIDPEMLSFDVKKGTGMISSALSLYDRTIGQVSPIQIPMEYKKAELILQTLQRDATRALAASSRPPVMEMQQIRQMIPQPNKYLENPETSEFQLMSFIDIMGNQYIQDLRDARNPNSPRQVRVEAEKRMSRIRSTLGLLLEPEALDSVFSSITATEEEIGDILNMSEEELNQLDISNLTDAQLDVLMSMLDSEQ